MTLWVAGIEVSWDFDWNGFFWDNLGLEVVVVVVVGTKDLRDGPDFEKSVDCRPFKIEGGLMLDLGGGGS